MPFCTPPTHPRLYHRHLPSAVTARRRAAAAKPLGIPARACVIHVPLRLWLNDAAAYLYTGGRTTASDSCTNVFCDASLILSTIARCGKPRLLLSRQGGRAAGGRCRRGREQVSVCTNASAHASVYARHLDSAASSQHRDVAGCSAKLNHDVNLLGSDGVLYVMYCYEPETRYNSAPCAPGPALHTRGKSAEPCPCPAATLHRPSDIARQSAVAQSRAPRLASCESRNVGDAFRIIDCQRARRSRLRGYERESRAAAAI